MQVECEAKLKELRLVAQLLVEQSIEREFQRGEGEEWPLYLISWGERL